ncbi:hypothetical protein [Spirosoma sp.]|uniref:hypothetical protein n=1 Tax=Spirosoma sp. TaxID=1899569 RepID=UPI003B3A1122
MRFIAVFSQQNTMHGIGFDALIEANDFLFWGYEDNDLTPCGIYDVLTDRTKLYDHFGRLTGRIDSEDIRRFAIEYLDRIRQHISV